MYPTENAFGARTHSDRFVESLSDYPKGRSKYLGTLVQLFRFGSSDDIAKSDTQRARKG